MEGAHHLLKALAAVLGVAAVTTAVFQRLRLPVVLGYVLAGLIVGPHVPIPLVADQETIRTLSELGVILVMFSLGLEFSMRKLVQVGPTTGLAALVESSFMLWLGFVVGRAFGWTQLESVFAGACLAISSTTIVAKAFDEHGVKGRLRELVFGILIVEDLVAILLLTLLTALATGAGLSAGTLLGSSGRLMGFLAGLVVVGLLVVPRAIRAVNRLKRPEITLVASAGLCFGTALLAQSFGYSVALGAFIAGSLVAESGEGKQIEHLITPVRDLFAAIFFVSVGMLIDPALVARHWLPVTVLTAAVMAGKLAGVSVASFLTGNGTRTSVQAGLSLGQIGELSFIIAALGISLGATREFLYPVAVAVSCVTALSTPLLIRAAGPVASFVDRKLPRAIQTFAVLYGSWLEQLREASRQKAEASQVRRLFRILLLDAGALAALVIGALVWTGRGQELVSTSLGLPALAARALVAAAAVLLALPFAVGVVRAIRRLVFLLAQAALPPARAGKVDLAAAPRRALVVTLQLALVLLVGFPVLALVQPFFHGWVGAAVLGALIVTLGVVLWRSATNLAGHVKASAEVIVEALVAHAGKGARAPGAEEEALKQIKDSLPGLGEPVPHRLPEGSTAVGQTLAQINLRGLTGASVLAIAREEGGVIVPSAGEALRAGDVLALAGTHEAVEAARQLLGGVRDGAG